MSVSEGELQAEQAAVDLLYARLDELRADASERLAQIRKAQPGGNHQARSERDAFATLYEDQVVRLNSVEDRLCFGRLDLSDTTEPRYIGRIGMSDDNQRQMLVDWRAPAAEPFYQATAGSPGKVTRRRHLITKRRTVTSLEDDVLDLSSLSEQQRAELSGEGALIAALDSHRTGRMGDIVATIQGEQDRIIRRELAGVLVVQGGPGTGKTAVALHRAAYLLYKHRDQIARSGVLLVGPSPVFLRYIEQVLPSLGETGAVLTTPGELFPGVSTSLHDTPEVAAVKGDLRMSQVIRRAIADRQRVPEADQVLAVESRTVVLTPRAVRSARERARRAKTPHNEARVAFVKYLVRHLTDQLAESLGGTLDAGDRAELMNDIRSSRDVRVAINLAWMPLTPQRFLSDLFSKPNRLAAATPDLSRAESRLLARAADAPWTVEDVPLLDEAAELIGEDPTASAQAAQLRREEESNNVKYAQSVLDMLSDSGDAGAYVSAGDLAERFAGGGARLTTAERAAEDRTWAFGHLVVDEAQELSAMMWRLLFRRVPSRSATLVGDIAQTSASAGSTGWADTLKPHIGDRWQLAELTINYRTPGQIMGLAADVIRSEYPNIPVPTSVRDGQWPPEVSRFGTAAEVLGGLPEAVERERELIGGGRIAVIVPAPLLRPAREGLASAGITAGTGLAGLDSEIAVLTTSDAKGLEFDGVIVLEPSTIRDASPRGLSDLYVALTRPTRRLRILTSTAFPATLQRSATA